MELFQETSVFVNTDGIIKLLLWYLDIFKAVPSLLHVEDPNVLKNVGYLYKT